MNQQHHTLIARFFQKQWQKVGCWHVVLIPLSCLFWLIVCIRKLAYQLGILKTYHVGVPVVVVGNISVGGTGKTPLVIWLTDQLKLAGFHPAIISRGYGGLVSGEVSPQSDPKSFGDEPVLLARRTECKVWVGSDRVQSAKSLLNIDPKCDVIISDDALQHYRLHRDFEIAVIDSTGQRQDNGLLLPAGGLRESKSRLNDVDAIVAHGGINSAKNTYGMKLEALYFYQLIDPKCRAEIIDFQGKSIDVVAGIGRPERFFNQLASMGLQFKSHAFPDHHPFTKDDMLQFNSDLIIMTEKDAVKCTSFAQPNYWVFAVGAKVDIALAQAVIEKIRS